MLKSNKRSFNKQLSNMEQMQMTLFIQRFI